MRPVAFQARPDTDLPHPWNSNITRLRFSACHCRKPFFCQIILPCSSYFSDPSLQQGRVKPTTASEPQMKPCQQDLVLTSSKASQVILSNNTQNKLRVKLSRYQAYEEACPCPDPTPTRAGLEPNARLFIKDYFTKQGGRSGESILTATSQTFLIKIFLAEVNGPSILLKQM